MKAFNISRLQAYQRCPRFFQLRYLENIIGKKESSKALDFGTGCHKAWETWYSHETWMDDSAAIRAFYSVLPEDHDEGAKEVETSGYGHVLLQRYFDFYRISDNVLIANVIGNEMELDLPMSDGTTLMVRLDCVAELNGPGKGLWHIQHKTLSAYSPVEDFVRQQQLAFHERAYKLAAAHHGMTLKGTLLNVVRKLQVPTVTHQKGGKKFKEQQKDLSDWIPFHRERLSVGAFLLEEFHFSWAALRRQMRACEKRNYWPQNPSSCSHYNQLCSYHLLCQGHPLDKEDWVEREKDYVDRKVEEKG